MVVTSVVAVFCGVIGLCVGSFVNVVIWRVPRKESVIRPRSRYIGPEVRQVVPLAERG